MKNIAFAILLIIGSVAHLIGQQKTFEYQNIGPSRGGRVTAVCGVVDSIRTFYMGATGGGLWKTTDSGHHWENISDGYFASPSIGAIAVNQKDSNIIYVGTGSDGIRSNVIVGKGIYKSEDAGKTWSFTGLKEAGQIGSLEIHPKISNTVFAAVIGQPFRKSKERGIYKSVDGGKTWEQKLFLSDSVGAVDVKFAPNNPDILYAAMWRGERKPWTIISGDSTGGIFKSIDGGEHWKKVTKGLPQNLIGKIDFAVSPDKPERVWALVQAPLEEEGLYKSDDYGEHWEHIEMPEKTQKSVMYRPFYFTNIDVNPKNADQLWTGTKIFWTSKDGGKSWEKVKTTHSDHHDLWVNPNNPNIMIEGNDGGASVSLDAGENWTTLFNQPTAELYSVETDDQYPYYLYSGQQDNSTIRVPSKRPRQDVLDSNDNHGLDQLQYWDEVGGCETGPSVPKPGDANIIYSNCKGQFGVYNYRLGFQQNYYVGAESLYGNHPDDITYRFQRVVPLEVSPHNPDVVYYGSQFVHKTINGGKQWKIISADLTANKKIYRMRSGGPIDEDISGEEYYNVLYVIEESPVKEGVIWTGSNDGLVHVTTNGGANWKNVTPKNLPEDGRVSKIHASSHDPAKAYASVYRDYLGDDAPYAYKTEDYGETWQEIVTGIPSDFPIRVIREDSVKSGLLFAGTEFGMFISYDDGNSWNTFQHNLPVVPITGIKIFRDNINISTLGRAFWVLEDISVLRQHEEAKDKDTYFFQPKDTYQDLSYFYFKTKSSPKDSVKFSIYNPKNELVHSKYETIEKLGGENNSILKSRWDMRHYLKVEGKKDFQGPKVAPGRYTIKLDVDGQTIERTFNYLINPELQKEGITIADLRKQEELSLDVAKLLVKIREKRWLLEKELKVALEKENIQRQLMLIIKGKERYDKPMLEDHVKYLYKMISESPQLPGEDAFLRFHELNKLSKTILE